MFKSSISRNTTRSISLPRSLTLGLVVLLVYGLPGLVAQPPSPKQRQVYVTPLNLFAPIQVTTVLDSVGAHSAPKGPHQSVTVVDNGPDWISDLAFIAQNNSPKDIVAIEVGIFIPSWQQGPVITFHEGQFPGHALTYGNGMPIPEESSLTFDVKPGATVSVPLSRVSAKLHRSFPSPPVPLSLVDNIRIQIQRVFFADGTAWAFNAYLKPDESSPGKYLEITPDEWRSRN